MSLFTPRTATVHVYIGDYHDRLFALTRRIEKAAASVDGDVATLDETSEHISLVEEYNQLVAEAAQHRIAVTLTQLPRKKAKELRKAHPPRVAGKDGATERDARNDDLVGVNEETFKEVIVPPCVLNATKPDGETVAVTPEDLEELSEGAYNRLYREALELNYGFVADPKEISLDSLSSQTSDKTSS